MGQNASRDQVASTNTASADLPRAWQDEAGDLYCALHHAMIVTPDPRCFTLSDLAAWDDPHCDYCGFRFVQ